MAAFGAAVLTKEVFVEIQLLKRHGFSLRQIARKVGCAVNTVRRQLAQTDVPTYVRKVDRHGEGHHRYHSGFLDYAKHCGFVIKLCRPYRAKTKGKVERFNGYLRRSFYVPLASRLKQAGLQLDVVTANIEVVRWLQDIANERVHGTTAVQPSVRLRQGRACSRRAASGPLH